MTNVFIRSLIRLNPGLSNFEAIVTRRSAVYSGDRIGQLESENSYLREQLAKNEEILKDPEKLRSKANTIEFKAKVSASQLVRMAQILTPDTSQVKGSSWSGKVPLTEDQIEELYQIGRTGALNFSFVETIG